jgi:RNA polymerase sigma-70 factor, ECF subfamily
MAVGPSTKDPEELVLYEGLRRGNMRSFRRLLELHSAAMLRVAGWYATDRREAERLVRRTWLTALDGLNMFTWHCTFRAWLFGILVAGGRAQAPIPATTAAPFPAPARPYPPTRPARGQLDWNDLPWSPVWSEGSWTVLTSALDALPLAQREVVRLRDVEGWPLREVCDVLGLTENEEHRLLHAARTELVERLRWHLGVEPCGGDCPHPPLRVTEYLEGAPTPPEFRAHLGSCDACDCWRQRFEGLAKTLLLLTAEDQPGPPDPDLMTAFRRWRTARGLRPWHRIPLVPVRG